jgi:hypothetical protein
MRFDLVRAIDIHDDLDLDDGGRRLCQRHGVPHLSPTARLRPQAGRRDGRACRRSGYEHGAERESADRVLGVRKSPSGPWWHPPRSWDWEQEWQCDVHGVRGVPEEERRPDRYDNDDADLRQDDRRDYRLPQAAPERWRHERRLDDHHDRVDGARRA